MEKRLDNSHYVVFGLVLLVLVMGVVSFVRSDAVPAQNNYVGHSLSQIVNNQGQTIDVNNNGIVDISENAAIGGKAMKLDPALANLIVTGFDGVGQSCDSDRDCIPLMCVQRRCKLLVNQITP